MPEETEKTESVVDDEIEKLLQTARDPLPGKTDTPQDDQPDELSKPPKQSEIIHVEPVVEPIAEPAAQDAAADFKRVVEKFNIIADKILDNFDSDRDNIEDTIQRLRDIFISTPQTKGFIVEGLVSALKTKSETNASIIKLLDSYARLISATKGTSVYQTSTTNIDLSSLLKSDPDDDE